MDPDSRIPRGRVFRYPRVPFSTPTAAYQMSRSRSEVRNHYIFRPPGIIYRKSGEIHSPRNLSKEGSLSFMNIVHTNNLGYRKAQTANSAVRGHLKNTNM
jgi:hypothetical protein